MAQFLRSAPFMYREFQDSFQNSIAEFTASVRRRSPGCEFGEPSAAFPDGTPEFPLGYWFLSPEQHLLELVVFNALFLPFIWWLLQRPLAVDVPALPSGHATLKGTSALASRACANHWALAALDTVCTSIVWVTGLLTFYFKLRDDCMGRPRLAYLLQPCHLSNFALCAMTFLRATPTTTWLFEFYLVTVFGALCALATPDMRGLDLFPFGWPGWEGYTGEKVSFVVQHVLLVVLPAIWIARRRFTLVKPPTADWRGFVTMWAVFSAIHWDLFAPVGFLTGHNINYMLAPPGGPLWAFGKYYRLVMLSACFGFSFAMRMSACALAEALLYCAAFLLLSFFTHSHTRYFTTRPCCAVFEAVVLLLGLRAEVAREESGVKSSMGASSGAGAMPSSPSTQSKLPFAKGGGKTHTQ